MRGDRIWAAGLGVLVASLVLAALYQSGPAGVPLLPECLWHRLTGLACPLCGMTRAVQAALHGRLAEAFRFNPLGMAVLSALGIFLALQVPAWLGDRPPPFRVTISPRGCQWMLGVMVGYWVLRNIPVWPFTLLAPP
jgi:hypothetical protein